MDVVITEKIEGDAIRRLESRFSVFRETNLWKDPDALCQHLKNAKALIVRNQTRVDKRVLEHARSLQVIGRAGVGYDNIDVDEASKLGIVVCHTPNENSISTAELTFSLILAVYKNLVQAHISTTAGNWDRYKFTGHELFGKTLGILGLGNVGARVASRAKGFGMKIIAYDKYLSPYKYTVTETGVELRDMEYVLANSDVISCHLPLTAETRGLLDISKLRLMKKTAVIVNTGRGEVLVEHDLVRALKEGLIAGAGLDVREKEPPGMSELNHLENVVLTPHIAGLTIEAQEKVVGSVANDVSRVLRGLPALNYVNFPVPRTGERCNGK